MSAHLLKLFIEDESGQGLTEYTAVLAFVALMCVLIVSVLAGTLKDSISQTFSYLGSAMTSMVSEGS